MLRTQAPNLSILELLHTDPVRDHGLDEREAHRDDKNRDADGNQAIERRSVAPRNGAVDCRQ